MLSITKIGNNRVDVDFNGKINSAEMTEVLDEEDEAVEWLAA